MLRKIWKNRLEFYPAFVFVVWYLLGAVLPSLGVRDPFIRKIGWITLPCVIFFIVAVVRAYCKLPPEGE